MTRFSGVVRSSLAAGSLSGLVLLAIGAFQAEVVARGGLQGAFGLVVEVLFWPGVLLAMVPAVALGHALGREGRVRDALAQGVIVGLLASAGYFLASAVLAAAMRLQPLASNPSVLPALDWSPYALFLVVACALGALVTWAGALAIRRAPMPEVARPRS